MPFQIMPAMGAAGAPMGAAQLPAPPPAPGRQPNAGQVGGIPGLPPGAELVIVIPADVLNHLPKGQPSVLELPIEIILPGQAGEQGPQVANPGMQGAPMGMPGAAQPMAQPQGPMMGLPLGQMMALPVGQQMGMAPPGQAPAMPRGQMMGAPGAQDPGQPLGLQGLPPMGQAQPVDQQQFARQVLDLVNQERGKAGLQPLSLDANLMKAAQDKSDDMVKNNYMSHYAPNGEDPFTRMQRDGAMGLAENIAGGQQTPQDVVNAWMGDEGHRDNILNAQVTKMGLGVADGGPYGRMWTQDFGI